MKLWKTKSLNMNKGNRCSYVRSCTILPNGSIIVVDENNSRIVVWSQDKTYPHDLQLSNKPFDVEHIGSNKVAVSYGIAKYIEILDIETSVVDKTLKLKGFCSGLTHIADRLYVLVFGHGIKIVNLFTLSVLNEIPLNAKKTFSITSCKDFLYCLDLGNDAIFCIDVNGVLIWNFKSPALHECQALTADVQGNIFVAAPHTNQILSISADGRDIKKLLDYKNGIMLPSAIYYDKTEKRLLVCDRDSCKATLYNFM